MWLCGQVKGTHYIIGRDFFLYVKNLTKKGLWGYVDKGVWIVRIYSVERIVKNRECG